MYSSALTSKGQVTIPSKIRKQLGLNPGDKVVFEIVDGKLTLCRKNAQIEASFGILAAKSSVSLEEMERVVQKQGSRHGSR